MANTYTQIYMHIIFAVGNRRSLISKTFEKNIYQYIAAACANRKHFLYAINGTADHIHLLLGMHPDESISNLVKSVKTQSTRFINENFLHDTFCWQSGYAAFSYSKSMVPIVKKYIDNQKEHHKRISFHDEFIDILNKAKIEYNKEYIMKDVTLETEVDLSCT